MPHCEAIAATGLPADREVPPAGRAGRDLLTHCKCGWLATVRLGHRAAPIYMAHDPASPCHVWVDEYAPRNRRGADRLELGAHGVPHTGCGQCAAPMQHVEVDLVIVAPTGTRRGEVATRSHLSEGAGGAGQWRALLGGAPHSAGPHRRRRVREIPIEERAAAEVTTTGRTADAASDRRIAAAGSPRQPGLVVTRAVAPAYHRARPHPGHRSAIAAMCPTGSGLTPPRTNRHRRPRPAGRHHPERSRPGGSNRLIAALPGNAPPRCRPCRPHAGQRFGDPYGSWFPPAAATPTLRADTGDRRSRPRASPRGALGHPPPGRRPPVRAAIGAAGARPMSRRQNPRPVDASTAA